MNDALLNISERAGLIAGPGPADELASDARLEWRISTYFDGDAVAFDRWSSLAAGVTDRWSWHDTSIDGSAFNRLGAEWYECLVEALDFESPADVGALAEALGLNAIFFPYIRWARVRLESAIEFAETAAGSAAVFDERIVDSLLQQLGQRLSAIVASTGALLINIEKAEGRLSGETAKNRLADFSAQILRPHRRKEIVSRFPVLDRKLAQAVSNYVTAVGEITSRVAADFGEISSIFGQKGAIVKDIRTGLGDPHCGGRSVCCIDLGSAKVIYKPRSLAADVAFQAVLQWLGQHIATPPKGQLVVDKVSYGWMEFVSHEDCKAAEDVKYAYRRMGSLLAVLNICGASDIHYENLIFSGDEPVAVDLETLLTGLPRLHGAKAADWRGRDLFYRTPMRIGYLPSPVRFLDQLLDLSAAGLVKPVETPFENPVISDPESDVPSVVPVRGILKPQGNSPRLGGDILPADDFVADLEQGFRDAAECFLSHKKALIAPGGLLAAFQHVSVRHVLRPTLEYARMLQASAHPTMLRSAPDQEMSWAALLPRGATPHLERLMRSERADLWNGDIPYFKGEANSKDIVDSRGQIIENFMKVTPYEFLLQNVRALSPEQIERHVFVLRQAFLIPKLKGGPTQPSEPLVSRYAGLASIETDFLTAADALGSSLFKAATLVDGEPFWITAGLASQDGYAMQISGPWLYDGAAGIGVFFAELFLATGDRRYAEMASKCLRLVRRTRRGKAGAIGAFEGNAGLAYAEYRIGNIIGDLDLRSIVVRLNSISSQARNDHILDVIAGSAGAVLVADGMRERSGLMEAAEAVIESCGTHLVQQAIRNEGQARWRAGHGITECLTGFSHGTTGIACALGIFAKVGGDEFAERLVSEALAYERSTFDEKRGQWSDIRDRSSTPSTWCHGATGMTLGRQKIDRLGLRSLKGKLCDGIEAGLEALRRTGGGGSHCLCHGAFGNAEPFIVAGDYLSARAIASGAAAEAAAEGDWRGGIANFAMTPGLMTGAAGIGLGLLRVANPTIQSILLLE